MTDSDLSMVTSDALIEELKRRYDATLVCLERFADGASTTTAIDYSGSISTAIGMAAVARTRLVRQAMDDLEEDDGDSADAM